MYFADHASLEEHIFSFLFSSDRVIFGNDLFDKHNKTIFRKKGKRQVIHRNVIEMFLNIDSEKKRIFERD